jgi:aminopeptidase N
MKTTEPRAVHLKDYAPLPYRIPELSLDFQLDGKATRVSARMKVERRSASVEPLVLNGAGLKLLSVALRREPARTGRLQRR